MTTPIERDRKGRHFFEESSCDSDRDRAKRLDDVLTQVRRSLHQASTQEVKKEPEVETESFYSSASLTPHRSHPWVAAPRTGSPYA